MPQRGRSKRVRGERVRAAHCKIGLIKLLGKGDVAELRRFGSGQNPAVWQSFDPNVARFCCDSVAILPNARGIWLNAGLIVESSKLMTISADLMVGLICEWAARPHPGLTF